MATRALILTLSTLLLMQGAVNAQGGWRGGNDNPGSYSSELSHLYHSLTRNYNRHVRPVQRASDVINVKVGLSLREILDFDEGRQTLHTLFWIYKMWNDAALKWDPRNFNGTETIRMPNFDVWKPELMLINSKSDRWEYMVSTRTILNSSGVVLFAPPVHVHTTCHVDLTRFPFDIQTCKLVVASLEYNSLQVDIDFYHGPKIDLSDYTPNTEWTIIETTGEKRMKKYDCCPGLYPELKFTLKLKRTLGPRTHTLVAPSVILALLIPVVFLLPTGSGEKTYLGTGVLTGLLLTAILFEQIIPRASHSVPVLVIYNLACVILTAISLMFAAVVNATWAKNGDVPGFLRLLFFSVLARVLCVPEEPPIAALDDPNTGNDLKSPVFREWRRLARVVDRLCLVLFLAVVVILTVAVLA